MRKTIVIALVLMCSMMALAQKKETIEIKRTVESWISDIREPEWYMEQRKAWQEAVDANPKDEWAWRNLFCATNGLYSSDYGEDKDKSWTADVIRKMEAAIPDSYTLNLCKCRFSQTTGSDASQRGDFIRNAVKLMPRDAYAGDVDFLACQLWSIDPWNGNVERLFRQSYWNNYYPLRIMQYNRNMLLSMQPNALYFANGDIRLAPMKIIQEALKERRDVIIIPISYFHSDSFMNALYQKLDIKPLAININDYGKYGEEWYKYYEADIIMYLINATQRPTYFSTDILKETGLNKDSIYNEGLLLKYSPVQYDNFAVAMHNVKEVYSLEYLTEPDLVYDSWTTSWMTDTSHITLLANLISKFRKNGDKVAADRLYDILSKCLKRCFTVENTNMKRHFENLLKEQQEIQE